MKMLDSKVICISMICPDDFYQRVNKTVVIPKFLIREHLLDITFTVNTFLLTAYSSGMTRRACPESPVVP